MRLLFVIIEVYIDIVCDIPHAFDKRFSLSAFEGLVIN